MAIEWGNWRYAGGNGMRVGIDVTWTAGDGGAIENSTQNALATIEVWTENQYSYSDGQRLSFGGAIGGSKDFTNSEGGAPQLRATRTYRYDYGAAEYGATGRSRTFSALLTGAYNGVTPSVSVTSKIPGRPIAAPLAPTNPAAARVSDTSQRVTWTNQDTPAAPWLAMTVQRGVGDNNSWVGAASPSGDATSAVDHGTEPNQKMRYRIRAENGQGNSGWVETGLVFTTPAVPVGCTRTPGAGDDQVVDWSNAGIGYPEYETEVWVSRDGVWALEHIAAAGVTQWTDTAATPAEKTAYKVRHGTTSGSQGVLYSEFSNVTSETPGILSPPAVPSDLSPAGISVDPTAPVVLSWVHNPTDGSAQSGYDLQHRAQGSPDWVDVSGAGGVWSHPLPADTYSDGDRVEWRARTYGAAAEPSPWSAPAVFSCAVTPIPEDPERVPVLMNLASGRLEASRTEAEVRDYVMRAQALLVGGGTLSVDSGYAIGWSQRFLPITFGRSDGTFPKGFHNIFMPQEWSVTSELIQAEVCTLTVATGDVRLRPGETVTVTGVSASADGQRVVRSIETNKVRFDVPGAADVAAHGVSGALSATITGHGGASSTVTSLGKIPLDEWTALYYDLPFGWGGGSTPRKNGVSRCATKSRTGGVATLGVPAPHYFTIGESVDVQIGDASFDGEQVITGVTQTTVSFANAGADLGSVAASGTVTPDGTSTFQGGFHVVSFYGNFTVPSNWLLIAVRNVDLAAVQWGTGAVVPPGFDSASPVVQQLIVQATSDVNALPGNTPALRLGDIAGVHSRMDGNETQSMSDDSTPGTILINQGGGNVTLGDSTSTIKVTGTGEIDDLYVISPATGSYTANVNWNSTNGRFRVNSSSARHKANIRPLPADVGVPDQLLQLEPRLFQRVEDAVDEQGQPVPEGSRPWYVGFISEEAQALGLDHWVVLDDQGDPFSFAYDYWVVALQVIVRNLADRLAHVESRLAALESRLP